MSANKEKQRSDLEKIFGKQLLEEEPYYSSIFTFYREISINLPIEIKKIEVRFVFSYMLNTISWFDIKQTDFSGREKYILQLHCFDIQTIEKDIPIMLQCIDESEKTKNFFKNLFTPAQ